MTLGNKNENARYGEQLWGARHRNAIGTVLPSACYNTSLPRRVFRE